MFGPNASWHSLAGRVSEEVGGEGRQQESVRDGEEEEVLTCGEMHVLYRHLEFVGSKRFSYSCTNEHVGCCRYKTTHV